MALKLPIKVFLILCLPVISLATKSLDPDDKGEDDVDIDGSSLVMVTIPPDVLAMAPLPEDQPLPLLPEPQMKIYDAEDRAQPTYFLPERRKKEEEKEEEKEIRGEDNLSEQRNNFSEQEKEKEREKEEGRKILMSQLMKDSQEQNFSPNEPEADQSSSSRTREFGSSSSSLPLSSLSSNPSKEELMASMYQEMLMANKRQQESLSLFGSFPPSSSGQESSKLDTMIKLMAMMNNNNNYPGSSFPPGGNSWNQMDTNTNPMMAMLAMNMMKNQMAGNMNPAMSMGMNPLAANMNPMTMNPHMNPMTGNMNPMAGNMNPMGNPIAGNMNPMAVMNPAMAPMYQRNHLGQSYHNPMAGNQFGHLGHQSADPRMQMMMQPANPYGQQLGQYPVPAGSYPAQAADQQYQSINAEQSSSSSSGSNSPIEGLVDDVSLERRIAAGQQSLPQQNYVPEGTQVVETDQSINQGQSSEMSSSGMSNSGSDEVPPDYEEQMMREKEREVSSLIDITPVPSLEESDFLEQLLKNDQFGSRTSSNFRRARKYKRPRFLVKASIRKLSPEKLDKAKWLQEPPPEFCHEAILIHEECERGKKERRWSFSLEEGTCLLYNDPCPVLKRNSFLQLSECIATCWRQFDYPENYYK